MQEVGQRSKSRATISVSVDQVGVVANDFDAELQAVVSHGMGKIIKALKIFDPVAESTLWAKSAEGSHAGNTRTATTLA